MKKFYGSLENRIEEGNQFCKEIKVGTGVTEYFYTDTKPYEVIEVINQNKVVIREMDAKRTDSNGMSDDQEYKYISNENNPKIELVKRNNVWYKVVSFSKEEWMKKAVLKEDCKSVEGQYNYYKAISGLTLNQLEKIEQGKEVKKYTKMNVSFGIMKKYHDYSF